MRNEMNNDDNAKENTRTKIKLLILDKFFLALIIAFVGFCYSYFEKQDESVYHFRGIIASMKLKRNAEKKDSKTALIFLGVGKQNYIQINIKNIKYFPQDKIGVTGDGTFITDLDKKTKILTVNESSENTARGYN